MTKSQLIELLSARHSQLAPKDAELAVKTMLDAMANTLASGNRIEIRGFGSFGLNYRPTRTGRNPKTGEKVWQERIDGIFTASPVAGDGKVYLVSETGDTIVLQAGRQPRILERNALDERSAATPAISRGHSVSTG